MKTRWLSFGGITIATSFEDAPSGRIIDGLCRNIPRAVDSDEPHVRFRLAQNLSNGGFQLFLNGDLDWEAGSAPEMMTYLLDCIVYHLAARSKGGLLLHAASLARKGRGLLLPGASGCGKTCLTAWLICHGFDYLSDELTFIPSGTTEIQGLSRPLCIKEGAQERLEGLSLSEISCEMSTRTGGRMIISPEKISRCRILPAADLQVIVFPHFQPSGALECYPITKAQAGLGLMTCLPNARNLPGHGFPSVSDIARRIPAFKLTYSHFDQIGELMEKMTHPI